MSHHWALASTSKKILVHEDKNYLYLSKIYLALKKMVFFLAFCCRLWLSFLGIEVLSSASELWMRADVIQPFGCNRPVVCALNWAFTRG